MLSFLHIRRSGLEKSLSKWHGRRTAGARHGHGMVCVNQTRPQCVNQMERQSKPFATRHGRETAWARNAMCELAFTAPGDNIWQLEKRNFKTSLPLVREYVNFRS